MAMYKGLYNIFKHWYHGGAIYIYSDPHFADEEMKYIRKNYIGDAEQIKRIKSKVGKNDTIIFLGDIGDVSLIKQIRGYKVLIKGNHDLGDTIYDEYFDEVYRGILTISDKVVLSHEPIEGLQPYLYNIHGHDHANSYCGERHMNVCAEHIDYTPVRLDAILTGGKLKDIESIHRFTIDKATERKAKRGAK